MMAAYTTHRLCRDDKDSITLGVTLMGHDVSYTVLDATGTPMLVSEEERYSRRKKGTFIPSPRRIDDILREAQVSHRQVRSVAIANIPEMMERRADVSREGNPAFGAARCSHSLFRAFACRLENAETVCWVRHHLCHAASAYLPSPYSTAAVVTVDGMGEDETAAIWHGQGSAMAKVLSIRHPHSLGYLYQAVAQWAGMTGAEREGKLMGLASFGKPSLLPLLSQHFLRPLPDGTFETVPALAALRCDNATWIKYCERYLGPRRRPDEMITEHHKDVAASMQALLEMVLLGFFGLAARLTGERSCCSAGGVFMNSMANGRLRRDGPFDDYWVQPMASDNGLSLGAALWLFAQGHPQHPRWRMTNAYLGSELMDTEAVTVIHDPRISSRQSDCVEREAASLLAAGKLLGWVRGRSEVGARALGHRSILADPRTPRIKDRLNAVIKQREAWRPFAPIVLEEEIPRLFDDPRPSPFMTFVAPARPGAPIAGALHVDGTGRLQTVSDDQEPSLYKLLTAFKALTGVGALLNTSFNVRGEPIVRTAEEAYRIFLGSGMDVLVLGDYIIEKRQSDIFVGPPVEAAAPRVALAPELFRLAHKRQHVIVVSLGDNELLLRVLNALNHESGESALSVYSPMLPGQAAYPFALYELLDCEGKAIPISQLPSADLFVVLLPTWTEVAVELIPNLLAPFILLAQSRSTAAVLFLDEIGGARLATELCSEWQHSGPRGSISEIEHFWITRRTQGKT